MLISFKRDLELTLKILWKVLEYLKRPFLCLLKTHLQYIGILEDSFGKILSFCVIKIQEMLPSYFLWIV